MAELPIDKTIKLTEVLPAALELVQLATEKRVYEVVTHTPTGKRYISLEQLNAWLVPAVSKLASSIGVEVVPGPDGIWEVRDRA